MADRNEKGHYLPGHSLAGPGVPSKYDNEEMPEQAFKLALLGQTNVEMAVFFEVDDSTIADWIARHPAFRAKIKAGRKQADAAVAASLYRRAIGEQIVVEKAFQHPDGRVEKVTLTQQVPGDAGAALQWLGLRQRDRWAKPTEVNMTANVSATVTTIDATKLSDAALAELMAATNATDQADSG